MIGFWNEMKENERNKWLEVLYTHCGIKHGNITDKMICYALNKPANWAIIAMQDLLGLDTKGRMNVPGVIDDVNWTWRMTSLDPFKERLTLLKTLNQAYKR